MPNFSAISEINSGLLMQAEFMAILSAPDANKISASSTDLMPPPAVMGMKTF